MAVVTIADAGIRSTLRAPDPALEPQDEAYIFTERNGIYIIDLQKTDRRPSKEAYEFVRRPSHGGTVLFVGTKKQAQEAVAQRSAALRHALRQQPLARRHAHQLHHHPASASSG